MSWKWFFLICLLGFVGSFYFCQHVGVNFDPVTDEPIITLTYKVGLLSCLGFYSIFFVLATLLGIKYGKTEPILLGIWPFTIIAIIAFLFRVSSRYVDLWFWGMLVSLAGAGLVYSVSIYRSRRLREEEVSPFTIFSGVDVDP